jgi:hypothetical protein
VIPANNKWYRNLAIATIINQHIADLGLAYPPPHFNPGDYSLD